ncbi:MAG: hypothetical protein AAGI67_03560 [Pseudomonadota bacterium]
MPTPSGAPSSPSAQQSPSAQPPGSSSPSEAGAESQANADSSAAGGTSELEVLEPEESEASADASAEPTWDEGESGGEESLAEASESSAGGGASGGEESLEEESLAEAGEAGASGGAPGGGDPTSGEMAAATGGMPGGASPAGTEQSLEAELNSSLEIFEGEMERTITILASNDDADGEAQGAAGGNGGEEEEGGLFDQTGAGAELVLVNGDPSLLPGGSQDVDGETGDEPITGRPGLEGGGTANETYPRVPGDVGDGLDDDVVARQIREAAINEDDPSLREKLWEEYRNYKKSIQ